MNTLDLYVAVILYISIIMSSLDDLGEKDVSGFKCPNCEKVTVFKTGYKNMFDDCEDCRNLNAVKCEECEYLFDEIMGYDKIIEFNNKIQS